jgi:hypothetical protein
MKRLLVMAVSIVLALTLAMPTMALGQVGQGATASGASGKLVTAWWQWALSKPFEDNPLFGGDPTYTEEQCDGTPLPGTVANQWFLAGTLGDSADGVVRTCTHVPADTHLFFPVANTALVLDPDETEAEVLPLANKVIDDVLADGKDSMVVTVDGKAVSNKRLVRAEARLFTGESPLLSEDGTPVSYRAVADGLWVTLPGLSEGNHTIYWKISAPNADSNPFLEGVQPFGTQDLTYRLTVG